MFSEIPYMQIIFSDLEIHLLFIKNEFSEGNYPGFPSRLAGLVPYVPKTVIKNKR